MDALARDWLLAPVHPGFSRPLSLSPRLPVPASASACAVRARLFLSWLEAHSREQNFRADPPPPCHRRLTPTNASKSASIRYQQSRDSIRMSKFRDHLGQRGTAVALHVGETGGGA